MNLNSEDFHNDCIDLLNEPMRNKQMIFNEEMNKVRKTEPQLFTTFVLRLESLCIAKKKRKKKVN